jgi:hypothetical protein
MKTNNMQSKAVIPTAAGILVPWGHPLVDDIESERDYRLTCSKCGLGVGWRELGHGVDGTVCIECSKDGNKAVQRLRAYRAA